LVAALADILSQQLAFCVIFVAKRSLAELEVCMELHKKVLETPTTLCTGLALDITLRESAVIVRAPSSRRRRTAIMRELPFVPVFKMGVRSDC
jgi:hypothetical protein